MLGMLEIVLGHHRIAGGLGIARQLEIFLRDMLGIAPDLDVRTVALEHPVDRISLATAAAARPVLMRIMLTLTCLILPFTPEIATHGLDRAALPRLFTEFRGTRYLKR